MNVSENFQTRLFGYVNPNGIIRISLYESFVKRLLRYFDRLFFISGIKYNI